MPSGSGHRADHHALSGIAVAGKSAYCNSVGLFIFIYRRYRPAVLAGAPHGNPGIVRVSLCAILQFLLMLQHLLHHQLHLIHPFFHKLNAVF